MNTLYMFTAMLALVGAESLAIPQPRKDILSDLMFRFEKSTQWSVADNLSQLRQADPNCPFAPEHLPEVLPDPLPDSLQEAFKQLGDKLDGGINNNTLPSAVISVAYKGDTIYTHGTGEIKKNTGKQPNEDTIYRIGSVSKVFPTLQLYKLAADSTSGVALDDSLSQHGHNISFWNRFDQKRGSGPGKQPSLRELASQRGGLPREAPCVRTILCGNATDSEMVKKIHLTDATSLIHPPGAELPSYSNMAFALLGREILPSTEDADTWEEWTQLNILNALDLNRTGFGLDLNSLTNAATGYDANGRATGDYKLGWTAPAGGMHSTTRDLNKLADAIMSGKALDNDAVLSAEIISPYFLNPGGTTLFGTPWEMRFHNKTGFLVRRKGGNVPGFTALLAFVPELRLSVSLLFNGAADEFGASQFIFDTLLPPFVDMLKETDPDKPRQPTDQDLFLGNYTMKGYPSGTPGAGAHIFAVDGVLILQVEAIGLAMYLRVPDWAEEGVSTTGKISDSHRIMQWWVQREKMPCLSYELLAVSGQYVIFEPSLKSFKIPGTLGDGIEFVRQ